MNMLKTSKFFGEMNFTSNKYFTFNRIVDEENIIVITENITVIKDSLALIVDNNKAIFLKDWQVEPVMNFREDVMAFAVKLNKNYMKEYTFKSDFDNVYFTEGDNFETLMEVARDQQEENMPLSKGWGRKDVEFRMWRR